MKSIGSYLNVRFGAYGPYEPPRKITTKWMRAVSERTARVHDSRQRREPDRLHARRRCRRRLSEAHPSAGQSGTVDFGSGAPIDVNTVVRTMAHVLDVDVTIRHEGHTEEFIEFRSVDRSMRDRFGVTPSISFEDGIRRLHRFLMETQNGAGQPA
jgi:nucleoside-diphosphate-sugar epimerase